MAQRRGMDGGSSLGHDKNVRVLFEAADFNDDGVIDKEEWTRFYLRYTADAPLSLYKDDFKGASEEGATKEQAEEVLWDVSGGSLFLDGHDWVYSEVMRDKGCYTKMREKLISCAYGLNFEKRKDKVYNLLDADGDGFIDAEKSRVLWKFLNKGTRDKSEITLEYAEEAMKKNCADPSRVTMEDLNILSRKDPSDVWKFIKELEAGPLGEKRRARVKAGRDSLIQQVLDLVDPDGSGAVDADELRQFVEVAFVGDTAEKKMRAAGIKEEVVKEYMAKKEEGIQEMIKGFSDLDEDKDGKISREELYKMVEQQPNAMLKKWVESYAAAGLVAKPEDGDGGGCCVIA